MSTEQTRVHAHYEDFSTPELQSELTRLQARQKSLEAELEAVAGPDPEGPVLWEALQDRIHHVTQLIRPMSVFVGGAVAPWPAGQERLHLYALPAQTVDLLDELIRQGPILADHHNRVIAVPTEWLHITLGHVEDATADQAERLAGALDGGVALSRERGHVLAETASMTPVVTEHGVLLEEGLPRVESALAPVNSLVRNAVQQTGGRLRSEAGQLHVATAYCHTAGPGRALADRIGRRNPLVRVRVRELALVWVTQDPAVSAYRWRSVASWPLTD